MASTVLMGDTSGSITLTVPAVAGSNTITLPASTGTVVTTGTPATGNVIQVVNATYSTQTSTSSTSYVDTGITVTITPKFATSKILASFSAYTQVGGDSDNGMGLQLVRNSTSIWSTVGSNVVYFYTNNGGINYSATHVGTEYLDSPATTSATTYKVQMRSDGTGASNDVYIQFQSSTSTITLMEIAG